MPYWIQLEWTKGKQMSSRWALVRSTRMQQWVQSKQFYMQSAWVLKLLFSTFFVRPLVIKLLWPSLTRFLAIFLGITCGIPPMLPNGKVTDVTGYNMLDTVSYQCLDGFQLTGPLFIWCQENSTWTSPPKCVGKYYCDEKIFTSITRIYDPFYSPLVWTKNMI